MKVKLENGIEYWVSWIHNNTLNIGKNKMDNRVINNSYTECYIQNKTNLEVNGIGCAILGKNEKFFNKDIGRKISLKHVLKNLSLNKSTRTLFWKEYFKMTNNGKIKS